MNFKRLSTALALAATSALVLAGCSAADTGATTAPEAAGDKGALAMSFAGLDIQIWVDQLDAMKPIIDKAGYTFLTDDPAWDIQTQVSDWETWVQRGDVKAIMGYPVQSDSMVSVTEKALAAGIPVLGYAGGWEGTTPNLVLDNYKDGVTLGTAAGEWIKKEHGTSAAVPVALLGYWDTDLGRDRSEGIKDGLKKSGANVSVNETSVVSLDDGYAATQSQLAAVPGTQVWLAMASDPALGMYQALVDSGVSETDPKFLLGSLDATDDILDVVKTKNSIWRLNYILPAQALAEANAKLLIGAAEGTVTDDITMSSTQVTPENADGFRTKK
jgi:ribose transport system substrate-binding protein